MANRKRRLGRFLRGHLEDVAVRRGTAEKDNQDIDVLCSEFPAAKLPYLDYESACKMKAWVQIANVQSDERTILESENRYWVHFTPPNLEIHVGDEVIRKGDRIGRILEQVLLITEVQIFGSCQRLRTEDRDVVNQ